MGERAISGEHLSDRELKKAFSNSRAIGFDEVFLPYPDGNTYRFQPGDLIKQLKVMVVRRLA